MDAADDERTVGPIEMLPREAPEGSYAHRRDELLRRARQQEAGCETCVEFALSLLVTGGDLERFRFACRVRRSEDRKGITSAADRVFRWWRLVQIWKGNYEGGFSMRGAGGRRQEFEDWCDGEVPSGEPRKRRLLETTTTPEPNISTCLDDLGAWADHLENLGDPLGHVEVEFSPVEEEWGEVPLPAERRRLRNLALQVEEYVGKRKSRSRGRKPTLPALARRMLALVSDGQLTEQQIRDLARQ